IGPAVPAATILPLFFVLPRRLNAKIPAVEEWFAAVNFLQKRQKQREQSKQRANGVVRNGVRPEQNYNLKEKLRWRFAADAPMADNRLNPLLHLWQLLAPSGWSSIAAMVMLVGYRNWRKVAA